MTRVVQCNYKNNMQTIHVDSDITLASSDGKKFISRARHPRYISYGKEFSSRTLPKETSTGGK